MSIISCYAINGLKIFICIALPRVSWFIGQSKFTWWAKFLSLWSSQKRDWHTMYSLILTFLLQLLATVMIIEWSLAYVFLLMPKILLLSSKSEGSLFQVLERILVHMSYSHSWGNYDIGKSDGFPHSLLKRELQQETHVLPPCCFPLTHRVNRSSWFT